MKQARVLKINSSNPDIGKIREAVQILKNGGLVAFPTETVYGLAALPSDELAVEKLRYIKNRYKQKNFSLCIYSLEQVEELAEEVSLLTRRLIKKFWPGPLTLVLKSKSGDTVGLRMPDHPVALLLLKEAGEPLLAPSANFPSDKAPANAQEVLEKLGQKIDAVIDSGPTKFQVSSAVCQVTGDKFKILRPGAISEEMISDVSRIKNILFVCTGNSCRSAMAEGLMKKLCVQKENIHVDSAGVAAFEGSPASKEATEVMRQMEVDISGHRSKRLTDYMVENADLILVMENAHKQHIVRRFPRHKDRVFLLKEFIGEKSGDWTIHDPIGMSIDFYERVGQDLKNLLERLVLKLG